MRRKRLSEDELDALIVREISRLPKGSPACGFADRVLWRVSLPQPGAVVLFGRLRSWVASPRRLLVLCGSYAAVATVGLALVVPWLTANSLAIGYALDWAAATSQVLVRDVVVALATWATSSWLAGAVSSVSISGPLLLLGASALTAGYAAAAIGLHLLLRTPRRNDAPVRLRA